MSAEHRCRSRMGSYVNFIALAWGLMAAGNVAAAVYYVAPGGTGDYKSETSPGPSPAYCSRNLAKSEGDEIRLAPGTYELTETTKGVRLETGVSIHGVTSDPGDTVLLVNAPEDQNVRGVYAAGSNTAVSNLTVTGAKIPYQGGGICAADDSFVGRNVVISNCVAKYLGGGAARGKWHGCTFVRNKVTNATEDQYTGGRGGGIAYATCYDCLFVENEAGYSGGALADGQALRCTLVANKAQHGGGASRWEGGQNTDCRLFTCLVSNNVASAGVGGGAYQCWMTNSVLVGNAAQKGAGMSGGYAVTCQIVGNRANVGTQDRFGGGCRNATCVKCLIADNRGDIGGGAIASDLTACILTNNVSIGGQGGAAYNSTTRNCWVEGNTSANYGALCRGSHQGDVIVNNKALAADGNAQAYAAGICAADSGVDCTAVNCTIVGNVGCTYGITRAAVTNCVVCSHASDINFNCVSEISHSLWMTQTGTTPASAQACIAGAAPRFVSHPKESQCAYSLRGSSPCRDAGVYLAWMGSARDILGAPRVIGAGVDIGACEAALPKGFQLLFR